MELREKAAQLPLLPGVYLYKDQYGEVIYVGKAKNLRARVRSYFSDDRLADAKTGTLISDARDIEYILVDNNKEALALENNLIKQWKPRFNILLRDDKTFPYIKLTNEKYPRVYVTRRLIKDGSTYYGPYFPGNLAHRLVHFIHRHFKIPSCKVDLTRSHTHPCLEFHIHRCLGPCVQGLTTDEAYAAAVRDVRLFLEGRSQRPGSRFASDACAKRPKGRALKKPPRCAISSPPWRRWRRSRRSPPPKARTSTSSLTTPSRRWWPPICSTCATAASWTAVNISGKISSIFKQPEFFSSLLKQIYLDQQYIPSRIHVPVDFEDREELEELLSEKRGRKVEIQTPQRGQKKALLDLVETNAKHAFQQRFRIMQPSSKAMQEALQDALGLPEPPKRIECFDISHIQGTDKVASMVVWEDGRMKKSDYRKFIIRTVVGNDDFASMREVVTRRYSRLQQENKPFPSLILIDGGLGQLHAAVEALEAIGVINQPVASIAKREEIIYVYGQENEPIQLDHYSPVLHVIQKVRDEAHRFAVTFHRTRRSAARLTSELEQVDGIGAKTIAKLLREFGSLERVREASAEELAKVIGPAAARRLREYYNLSGSG